VLLSTILASSMAFIDGSALNVALPALQTGLHASGVQLLWVVNAYLLMLAALIPVGGSLGDVLGRKKVFAIGISLFIVASLVCGIAPTAGFLIVARLIQGIGSALMIPGSLSIITAFYGPDKRGQAIGTWAAATTISLPASQSNPRQETWSSQAPRTRPIFPARPEALRPDSVEISTGSSRDSTQA